MPKMVKVVNPFKVKDPDRAEMLDYCWDNKDSFRDEGKQELTEQESRMKQESKLNVMNLWTNNRDFLVNKCLR